MVNYRHTLVTMASVPKKFGYLVIGGGSGGIASARRAAEYNVKVGLIEEGKHLWKGVGLCNLSIFKIFEC